MPEQKISRTVIHVPARPARTSVQLALHALKGVFLAPVYWLLAAFFPTPGLRFRARCFMLGARALFSPIRRLPLRAVFHLLFMPMDSTRYFEFDIVWRLLARRPMRRYLDVSSPRLLPIALLAARPGLAADLINPNPRDLQETRQFVDFIGAGDRCRLHDCLIDDARFPPGTFDVITSISVLEHIPEDVQAVRRIWELLKPGGVFVLTVPCMAKASEQYIDHDEFALLQKNQEGNVFWQRFYDQELLEQRVFCVTGRPQQIRVFGEKVAGTFFRNAAQKRADPDYPYWREPFMMATGYRYFKNLDELPGDGVVGLLFEKQK